LITLNVFEVAMTTFHSLTVAKVEPETRDAVTITFAIPDALRGIRLPSGPASDAESPPWRGRAARCYSICRSRSPGEISVAVKAIDGGRFSRYAQSDIQQGMALEVMVPQGHFGYQPQAGRWADYWRLPPAPGSRR
jgi:ring-1,2-phenylacetyl-CoA epoxidase subunit PaaE